MLSKAEALDVSNRDEPLHKIAAARSRDKENQMHVCNAQFAGRASRAKPLLAHARMHQQPSVSTDTLEMRRGTGDPTT